MDWGKFIYLLGIVLVGYLPYKTLQRVKKHGLNDVPWWGTTLMSIWFVCLSVVLFLDISLVLIRATPLFTILFGSTMALWIIAPAILRRVSVFPSAVVQLHPSWFLVRAELFTFCLKFFEVLFQQTMFLFLLVVVLTGLPELSRILWFTAIVSVLHLGNFFVVQRREAFLFFLLSIPMGLLFSYLLLYGFFLLTTSIHLWFYLCFASWFRLRRSDVTI